MGDIVDVRTLCSL